MSNANNIGRIDAIVFETGGYKDFLPSSQDTSR